MTDPLVGPAVAVAAFLVVLAGLALTDPRRGDDGDPDPDPGDEEGEDIEAPCELCGHPDAEHLVESDAGLWPTLVPMCSTCHEQYENGRELAAFVRRVEA